MGSKQQIEEAFPELDEIDDEQLREAVVGLWVDALEQSAHDNIQEVPRSKTEIPAETEEWMERLIPHVRDVTVCSIALTDALEETLDLGLDRDLVVAGALLHDVSKLYERNQETRDNEPDKLGKRLGHATYAVHLLAEAGLSLELQHLVLSHTPSTGVDPQTMEAEIVHAADMVALHGLFYKGSGEMAPHVSKAYH